MKFLRKTTADSNTRHIYEVGAGIDSSSEQFPEIKGETANRIAEEFGLQAEDSLNIGSGKIENRDGEWVLTGVEKSEAEGLVKTFEVLAQTTEELQEALPFSPDLSLDGLVANITDETPTPVQTASVAPEVNPLPFGEGLGLEDLMANVTADFAKPSVEQVVETTVGRDHDFIFDGQNFRPELRAAGWNDEQITDKVQEYRRESNISAIQPGAHIRMVDGKFSIDDESSAMA